MPESTLKRTQTNVAIIFQRFCVTMMPVISDSGNLPGQVAYKTEGNV